nr:MAG TPA: hypothetical protein [Caudoviricetes sp.]
MIFISVLCISTGLFPFDITKIRLYFDIYVN